jgi:hypothetical protein
MHAATIADAPVWHRNVVAGLLRKGAHVDDRAARGLRPAVGDRGVLIDPMGFFCEADGDSAPLVGGEFEVLHRNPSALVTDAWSEGSRYNGRSHSTC